jgi:ATP phosphoribosyltransferase
MGFGQNGSNGTNGTDGGAGGVETRPRQGSRSLPTLTDILGNSLNDRLLFAVPKSMLPNLVLRMLDHG